MDRFLREYGEEDSGEQETRSKTFYADHDKQHYNMLNTDQKAFVDKVVYNTERLRGPENIVDPSSILPSEHLFMLCGDGGTGKTFTFNVPFLITTFIHTLFLFIKELIARLKAKNFNVTVTASTGIAAILLFEGSTMHSKFRIPLKVKNSSEPTVDYESRFATILRQLDVLIIDEISAGHKDAIIFIHKTLCSIANAEDMDRPFGGKVIKLEICSF